MPQYPLALTEKEQLATASSVLGSYDSTQSATPILVTRNAEPIRQNIRFKNTMSFWGLWSTLLIIGV